ncbi:tetratricopeptide repeat protein [Azoarcus indigens]|uniref:Tetratricopeptide repeat protein n=2 Tax=Azoarcus indigens TaxID=29545 RepID=A0A4R6DG73_9RHOO|nr:tetratricopeptide repeat protein [Azoarcus indigens]
MRYHPASALSLPGPTMSDSPPRALALFTDRNEQRANIDAHLERLRLGLGHTQGAVLSFYGVGGVGKTTLREKGIADFRAKLARDRYNIAPFALAELDLDSDSIRPDLPVALFLGRVRTALRKAGLATPLFDYIYLTWLQAEHPDQAIKLRRHTQGEGAMAGLLDIADLIGNLGAAVGLSVPSMATAQGFNKLFPRLGEWFQHSRAHQRFDASPQSWSQRERTERMPTVLALDLLEAIAHHPQTALCLVIDGFERVQSRESRPDAQWALATLVAEVLHCADTLPPPDGKPLRGRIGFIVFGREKLRWAEFYGRERVRTDWAREINDQAELLGLTEDDARGFLIEKAAAWERAQGRHEIAGLIQRHLDAVLRAAAEHLPGRPPSFLPYYLDLAVLMIRDNAGAFTPDLLGDTPAELERRFLRNLAPGHLRALQALAVALEFDRGIFDFLRARGDIEGHDFAWLVGEHWSFVNPAGDRPGFHGFHRHMQASLIASLGPAEEKAWARDILTALLDRLFERMRFERPADFGPVQESALADAISLLREHVADGLLDGETALTRALAFEEPFEGLQAASLRRPFLDWTQQTAHRLLGAGHPDALVARSNFASLIGNAGESSTALQLFRALLPDIERVLGADHSNTLITRANIASWTGDAGHPENALTLFRELLPDMQRLLGPGHPATLVARNNIAFWTGKAGNPEAALKLLQELLPDVERILGHDHPHALGTRANIARATWSTGKPALALTLFQDLLPAQIRVLGAEHPDTLSARYDIASLTWDTGDPTAALVLFHTLLPEQEQALGPDHLDTLSTRESIAALTGSMGEPAAALSLLHPLLADMERVLGAGHSFVLDTLALVKHLEAMTTRRTE